MCGGAEGDRTPDLHDANVALSQLSYRPTQVQRGDCSRATRALQSGAGMETGLTGGDAVVTSLPWVW